jgi:hypothetical protein
LATNVARTVKLNIKNGWLTIIVVYKGVVLVVNITLTVTLVVQCVILHVRTAQAVVIKSVMNAVLGSI